MLRGVAKRYRSIRLSKILIFSDNHFCATSSIVRGMSGEYTTRLDYELKTIQWLTETARQNDCKSMFCLGDFFDSPTLNSMEIGALSRVDWDDRIVYFLVGNHELGRNIHSFSSAHVNLLHHDVEDVFDKPVILSYLEDNLLIYVLPYQVDVKEDAKEYFVASESKLPEYMKYYRKILFSHNDLKGIQMGKFISTSGLDVDKLSKDFDLTLNGHLHNSEFVRSNVLNVGNVIGQNFSEDAFKYSHNCWILDLGNLSITPIENPYSFNFYSIDLTDPKHNIDWVNKFNMEMKRNTVLNIKVKEEDSHYYRVRFDPTVPEERLLPRCIKTVAARIQVVREKDESKTSEKSFEGLRVNHLEEFQNFVLENIGNSPLVREELVEVIQ